MSEPEPLRPSGPRLEAAEPRSLDLALVPPGGNRIRARGKFLYRGDEKLYLKGVTYGTFRPNRGGEPFPEPDAAERDLAAMAARGFNALRTYTVPPRWLLDLAEANGLQVMVGLPWEQHVAFLDDRKRVRAIRRRVVEGVAAVAGHPAVFCHAIGNEIPAPIVRWHGRRPVERFLEGLCRAVGETDPESLVTYVNYPTTEYLDLSFLDLLAFNVYLETRESLEAYLARLHNLAGERPLLMAEIGLDSRAHGERSQAVALDWQVHAAFESGCAGTFVFGWTDEWHRGGFEIEDWDFGLTSRDRCPKAALAAVERAYAEAPMEPGRRQPRISVVVCSYNGAATIEDTLKGLALVEYPNYEVIVVDDGSTDGTAAIARRHGVRLISTENRGLSAARNTGMVLATGELVGFIDDDAYPDPHWLTYLARAFAATDHAGIGGPNVLPPEDGPMAECVANAPGGPAHVLLTDSVAEHIPGCNMAFRRDRLLEIGGFDQRFRTAGDDVDVCWRLQERGWTLGFHPGALVWHHRRGSLRTYWKQQVGYGRAEALLERKWPERYNRAGHVPWGGRIYGRGLTRALLGNGGRVYQGTWGTAPFQSIYQRSPGTLLSLPLMPEWYLLTAGLAPLAALGLLWPPLLLAVPFLAVALLMPVAQACLSAARAPFADPGRSRLERWKLRAQTAVLHLLQPAARLWGRLRHGLTPWRRKGVAGWVFPRPRRHEVWSEEWREPADWMESVEVSLRASGGRPIRGGSFDRWDLELRGGLLGGTRVLMTCEEHGSGRQLVRFRVWPRYSRGLVFSAVFAALGAAALLDRAWTAAAALLFLAAAPALTAFIDSGTAQRMLEGAVAALGKDKH